MPFLNAFVGFFFLKIFFFLSVFSLICNVKPQRRSGIIVNKLNGKK